MEPSLGQVRDELKADLGLDQRVRAVEISQAIAATSLDGLRHQVEGMEERLMTAIEANKPKPVWPAVSAIVALVALLLVVSQALYAS
jgi:hypothetical protein